MIKNSNKLILVVLMLMTSMIFAQQKTKRELREAQKIEQQKQTEVLITSQQFVFNANRAFPLGYRSIDLTTNPNSIEFRPDLINSDMPYFGRATGSIPYGGGDGGLKFKGKPEGYSIEKRKKEFLLKANVKDKNDNYRIQLSVFFDGSASLVISSNNRSSISYLGRITAIPIILLDKN